MATDWRITGQRQGSKLMPDGTMPDVMEVRFETIPEGIPGLIEFPLRVYEPEFVESEISRYVAKIKAVQAL